MDDRARTQELRHEVAEARLHVAEALTQLEQAARPRRVAGSAAAGITARAAARGAELADFARKRFANRNSKATIVALGVFFGSAVACAALALRRATPEAA